jgi:hypothetical protein
MRSQVRFPVLPWGFFLEGEDSRGDHGLGSLVELRFKALLVLHIHISPSGQRNRASWTSQPQKSVTLRPQLGRGDHEVHKGHVVALKKNISHSKKNPASYYHRCTWVFTSNTWHSYQILIKFKLSRHVVQKYLNIWFHENPSSGSQVIPCGQTDMTKLKVAFAKFRKRLKWQSFPAQRICIHQYNSINPS